ncbi:SPOR domain-containing protein [Roseobacter sp.]|uniref:SPOR domain-containing protein n=1 Tax=Roseobacter sp. TaxID=1907202 RepID=UPI0032982899
MSGKSRYYFRPGCQITFGIFAMTLLSACDTAGGFNLADAFKPKPQAAASAAAPAAGDGTQQDVEAPEIFAANEAGLWDGRPSLGGVWVAHPDVTDPERVLIRNASNGQFVVGALFRRERDIPGPRLQMSSDAAEALGILAGAPTDLEVVALRKELVVATPPPAQDTIAQPAEITETSLDPIAAAGAAIDAAAPTPASPAAADPAPVVQSSLPQSALSKPFIQIGIFSQQANAQRAAKQMRGAGLIPTVKEQQLGGKPFWRVVVGPAGSASEQKTLLSTIKGEGFSDAYAVSN